MAAMLLAGVCFDGRKASAVDSTFLNISSAYVVPGNWDTIIPPVIAGQNAIFAPNILPGTAIDLTGVVSTITPSAWIFQAGTKDWFISSCGPGCSVQTNVQYQANAGNTVTINVPLVGSSSVGLSGSGTLVLDGANTYTGLTAISSGTLVVNSTLGSGSVTNNSQLTFHGAGIIANQISGTGQVTFQAGGTLTADNTYSGGTVINNNSVLTLGNGGATGSAGSGNIIINNNSTLSFNRFDIATVANNISGSGAVFQTGAGTTELTGTNAYTGTTTISAGTLQLGTGGTSGTLGSGNVINNGTLAFNRSDAFVVSNDISGSGGLMQLGSGLTSIHGNNTYTGTTTISAGTLDVGGGGTSGTLGTGDVINNSVLTVNRSDAITISGNIFGTGVLNKNGAGTLTLTGNNNYSGTTTINGGTLAVLGSLTPLGTGNVVNNATLDINGSNLSNDISGSGALIVSNSSQLLGTNTYTGTTTISAGRLQIGNGGTAGTLGTGNVTNNDSLIFNRSDAITVANTISGTGDLKKSGAGSLMLTAVNSYTGATIADTGSLFVQGSIATSSGLTVNSGALLGGHGTLPSTVINAGGTLSPGNSIGTITVAGNLTFAPGSNYVVEVSPTTADRTNVTGTAALAGTVQATFLPGTQYLPHYTILSSAGLGGTTFDGITAGGVPANFAASLSYTPTDVVLDYTAVLGASSGGTINERAVAAAINGFFNGGGTLPPGFLSIYGLTGNALNAALTQLSGEVGATTAQTGTQSMNAFLSQMLNPYAGAPEGNPGSVGYARGFAAEDRRLANEATEAIASVMPVKAAAAHASVYAPRWNVWVQGYGGADKTTGDTVTVGSHDTSGHIWGVTAGADYRANDTFVGFALAGGATSWGLAQGLGSGKSDIFQAGAYASHRFGAAFVSAALAYSWYDMTTDRTLTVAGTDTLRANFRADNIGARFETGYRIANRIAAITPYVAVQAQNFRTPSYGETAVSGSSQFALSYSGKTTRAIRTEFGSWFDKEIARAKNGDAIALRGRVAWANDSGNGGSANATFQSLPGASFTVLGNKPPTNLALLTAGAELRLKNRVSLGVKFDAEVASRYQSYSGTGTISHAW
jgi:autotransporter-associated beta strand protein